MNIVCDPLRRTDNHVNVTAGSPAFGECMVNLLNAPAANGLQAVSGVANNKSDVCSLDLKVAYGAEIKHEAESLNPNASSSNKNSLCVNSLVVNNGSQLFGCAEIASKVPSDPSDAAYVDIIRRLYRAVTAVRQKRMTPQNAAAVFRQTVDVISQFTSNATFGLLEETYLNLPSQNVAALNQKLHSSDSTQDLPYGNKLTAFEDANEILDLSNADDPVLAMGVEKRSELELALAQLDEPLQTACVEALHKRSTINDAASANNLEYSTLYYVVRGLEQSFSVRLLTREVRGGQRRCAALSPVSRTRTAEMVTGITSAATKKLLRARKSDVSYKPSRLQTARRSQSMKRINLRETPVSIENPSDAKDLIEYNIRMTPELERFLKVSRMRPSMRGALAGVLFQRLTYSEAARRNHEANPSMRSDMQQLRIRNNCTTTEALRHCLLSGTHSDNPSDHVLALIGQQMVPQSEREKFFSPEAVGTCARRHSTPGRTISRDISHSLMAAPLAPTMTNPRRSTPLTKRRRSASLNISCKASDTRPSDLRSLQLLDGGDDDDDEDDDDEEGNKSLATLGRESNILVAISSVFDSVMTNNKSFAFPASSAKKLTLAHPPVRNRTNAVAAFRTLRSRIVLSNADKSTLQLRRSALTKAQRLLAHKKRKSTILASRRCLSSRDGDANGKPEFYIPRANKGPPMRPEILHACEAVLSGKLDAPQAADKFGVKLVTLRHKVYKTRMRLQRDGFWVPPALRRRQAMDNIDDQRKSSYCEEDKTCVESPLCVESRVHSSNSNTDSLDNVDATTADNNNISSKILQENLLYDRDNAPKIVPSVVEGAKVASPSVDATLLSRSARSVRRKAAIPASAPPLRMPTVDAVNSELHNEHSTSNHHVQALECVPAQPSSTSEFRKPSRGRPRKRPLQIMSPSAPVADGVVGVDNVTATSELLTDTTVKEETPQVSTVIPRKQRRNNIERESAPAVHVGDPILDASRFKSARDILNSLDDPDLLRALNRVVFECVEPAAVAKSSFVEKKTIDRHVSEMIAVEHCSSLEELRAKMLNIESDSTVLTPGASKRKSIGRAVPTLAAGARNKRTSTPGQANEKSFTQDSTGATLSRETMETVNDTDESSQAASASVDVDLDTLLQRIRDPKLVRAVRAVAVGQCNLAQAASKYGVAASALNAELSRLRTVRQSVPTESALSKTPTVQRSSTGSSPRDVVTRIVRKGFHRASKEQDVLINAVLAVLMDGRSVDDFVGVIAGKVTLNRFVEKARNELTEFCVTRDNDNYLNNVEDNEAVVVKLEPSDACEPRSSRLFGDHLGIFALTSDEEAKFAEYFSALDDQGFPIPATFALGVIREYAQDKGRSQDAIENLDNGWWQQFQVRNQMNLKTVVSSLEENLAASVFTS